MEAKVVTRFAPSPTGFLHVGGIRTALYAYLWAKKNNGTFILRIEDTDKEREVPGSVEHIIDSLEWLALKPDKGPILQSTRLENYRKWAEKLVASGHAYPDPYTEAEIDEFRKKAEAEGKIFLYRDHRPENIEAWDGKKALRFKTPEIKSFHWHDLVYGDLSAGPEALDDFILIKADGYPTYNFAHIVDDIEMNVTHVMRGTEFIASTPKFLSLYEALEMTPPLYATMPVILGPDGKKKLSKRDGAKDIFDYKKEGYLPEALINFLALLGWNPGTPQEIFTKEELIQAFEISKVQKSGAKLDQVKLDWMNKEHIKKLPKEVAVKNILDRLPPELKNEKLAPIIFERVSKWGDIDEMVKSGEFDFMLQVPEIDKVKLVYKDTKPEKITENLKFAIRELENMEENSFTKENIKNTLMLIADNLPSRGELLHPVRYALSGREKSPDPFTIAEILGKNETISRLQKAI